MKPAVKTFGDSLVDTQEVSDGSSSPTDEIYGAHAPRSLLLVEEVRAWPQWGQVSRWTSPANNWKPIPRKSASISVTKRAGFVREKNVIPTFHPIHVPRPENPTTAQHVEGRRSGAYTSGDGASVPVSLQPQFVFEPLHNWVPPDPESISAPLVVPSSSKKSNVLRRLALLTTVMIIAGTIGIVQYVLEQRNSLPLLPDNPGALLSQTSTILAADGSELGSVFGERRTSITSAEMGSLVLKTLLAAEDHRYMEHNGVDYKRIAGAAWKTLQGDPEGASTIPMQLARNIFSEVRAPRMADRKVRELLMARRISERYPKEVTLEWYLNTVAFGHNSFGIEAAAQRFFSQQASDLELHQAALLIGLLKGPSRYDPFRNATLAKQRRNVVITRMQDLEMISTSAALDAKGRPLGLKPSIYDPAESIAPQYVNYVRREAEKWATENGYNLKEDGLTIHTTLDPELQKMATLAVARQTQELQNIITREFGTSGSSVNGRFWRSRKSIEDDLLRKTEPYRVLAKQGQTDYNILLALRTDNQFVSEVRQSATQLEAGFVAIDPRSGQVKAWVGGRDFRKDQFDKVASARRQPGSIFKPFVYAVALERGFSPHYMVEDQLKTFSTNARGERWRPTNSGGGASGRLVSLRQGLAWSKNTVSAHLISRVGAKRVVDLAKKMGVSSPMKPVPSIALGTSETTLLEMVSSYATFADYGKKRNVSVITSILDREGNVVGTFPSSPTRALSSKTSYTIIDMLRQVVDGGTGSFMRSKFGIRGDLAGKTGTTQNNADGWFVLMHPDLVTGAWVGFNDQRIAFQSNYWGQGGHNALLLVGDFMKQATSGPGPYLKRSRFSAPEGYVYPKKPVYSRPVPKEKGEVDSSIPEIPPSRMSPRQSVPLPIQSFSSNGQ